jgi:hypothetical protein
MSKVVGKGDRIMFVPVNVLKPVEGIVKDKTIDGRLKVEWQPGKCYYLGEIIEEYNVLEVIGRSEEADSK